MTQIETLEFIASRAGMDHLTFERVTRDGQRLIRITNGMLDPEIYDYRQALDYIVFLVRLSD